MTEREDIEQALTQAVQRCARTVVPRDRDDAEATLKALFPGHEGCVERSFRNAAAATTGLHPTPRAAPGLSSAFGPYRLLNEIGRGGQGVVWLALDERLHRKVALKVLLHAAGPGTEAHVERFRREARAASRLDHPGICTVYEAGVLDGLPFIAMRYVEGSNLAIVSEALRRGEDGDSRSGSRPPLRAGGLRTIVQLVAKAARVLHAAHEAGVIHRDVKPGNIMVTPDGEPVVLDFGLARTGHDEAGDLTRTGDVFGTPAYMSPEQIGGRPGDVDLRADVWALGVTLYECLTGTRPFSGVTRARLFEAIAREDPPHPRRTGARLGRDLATILAKALEKDPARRYQTAAELAQDLDRWLSREPVLARPAGPILRALRWAQRRRALAAAAAGVFLALAASLSISLWLLAGARTERSVRAEAVAKTSETLSALRAAETAESLALAEKRAALDRVLRLADQQEVQSLLREDEDLWPAVPEKIPAAGGFDSWIRRAEAVLGRADGEPAPGEEDPVVPVAAGGEALEAWRRHRLADLRAALGTLREKRDSVKARREFAAGVVRLSVEEPRALWEETIRAVADPAGNPHYRGLVFAPQRGLVPLGQDPDSRLFEFVHLQTGKPPRRTGTDGRLRRSEATGLVLVLVPGGTFRMGAEPPSDGRPLGQPNVDPAARPEEGPVREVTVAPFFISKFEMTQRQWIEGTDWDPSAEIGGVQAVPTESPEGPRSAVTFEEASLWLGRLGLQLPTESQWEYAARAGTTTIWPTGDDRESLDGFANLADASSERDMPNPSRSYESWLDDGQSYEAPVGRFQPNAFGLHDVCGNIAEFCRLDEGAPETGTVAFRRLRGGSFLADASHARSAWRGATLPGARQQNFGVRPARRIEP